MLVELVTVADVPLKVTALFAAVVSKFVPTMVTAVSTVPPDGEKLEIVGAGLPQPDRISRRNKVTKAILFRYPYTMNMVDFLSVTSLGKVTPHSVSVQQVFAGCLSLRRIGAEAYAVKRASPA